MAALCSIRRTPGLKDWPIWNPKQWKINCSLPSCYLSIGETLRCYQRVMLICLEVVFFQHRDLFLYRRSFEWGDIVLLFWIQGQEVWSYKNAGKMESENDSTRVSSQSEPTVPSHILATDSDILSDTFLPHVQSMRWYTSQAFWNVRRVAGYFGHKFFATGNVLFKSSVWRV